MARVKKKEYEKLTDANLRHVIALLYPQNSTKTTSKQGGSPKPITKKAACDLLNITYNTTRLQKIIDEFIEKEEFTARRKAENRGKRASKAEITDVIRDYLQAEPISQIAKGLYRSSGFVKGIIDRVGVPQRATGDDKYNVSLLPDQCIAEDFDVGEIVWAAKYHAPAIVLRWISDEKYKRDYGSECYQISVIEPVDSSESYFKHIESGGFNAFALAYDLGSLKHLEEYGIDLKNIS